MFALPHTVLRPVVRKIVQIQLLPKVTAVDWSIIVHGISSVGHKWMYESPTIDCEERKSSSQFPFQFDYYLTPRSPKNAPVITLSHKNCHGHLFLCASAIRINDLFILLKLIPVILMVSEVCFVAAIMDWKRATSRSIFEPPYNYVPF